MTLKIKVCGMTEKNNSDKIQKLDVDYIGFINIERSKRNISLDKINSFQKDMMDKNKAVLVVEPENPYEVITKSNMTQIFNIQLHSLNCHEIRYILWANQYYNNKQLNITKTIGISDKIDKETQKQIDYNSLYATNILLDYKKDGLTGGTNTHIPIDTAIKAARIVKQKHRNTDVTLAGGLDLEYLEEIQDKLHYFDRIDLNSGVEDKPGIKNIKKIKQIIKLVKE